MRPRRGVALLAALWLVVAIAAVAVQFSLDARERRTIGILASERGVQRGLALGALARVRSEIDQTMRGLSSSASGSIANLRASDPLLEATSTYNGSVLVDSVPVEVATLDLGSRLNINQANETEFQAFFSFLLKDYSLSVKLAQAIMDWRDVDTLPRPSGAEADAYVKAGLLALPTNAPFRDVDDLRNVYGMTPEIFAEVSPYLTVRGNGQVNLNTAPPPVLRALPGMTDQILNMIVIMRSQGRRINNVADVMRNVSGGRGGQANPFGARAGTTTSMIEMTFTARSGPQASPTKLIATLRSQGTSGVAVVNTIW